MLDLEYNLRYNLEYKHKFNKEGDENMKDLGKKIVMSIDPGYDATKVTVNGEKFDLLKETVKKIGNEYEQLNTLVGIYEVKMGDEVYLCGPNIKVLLDDNKDFHERFDKGVDQSGNYSYFNTKEFLANSLAAISMGLIKASAEGLCDLKDIDSNNLYIIVELPHEALENMHTSVKRALAGEHNITFTADIEGTTKVYELSFKINEKKLLVTSQVIACLLGYMTDEEGYEIDSLKDLYPALVIDGGYYTVGDFGISKTKAISGAKSNTKYGMMVIHQKTAERINELCQTDYRYYDMKNLFDEEDGIVIIPKNISKSGTNEKMDVKPILEEVTREVFKEYLAYLEEKHNYFTKIKLILFGGGTGEIYYKLFCEVAEDYPNVQAKLVTYKMDKEVVTPRESISAGGYKFYLNKL